MPQKHVLDVLSAYVPQDKTAEEPVERLIKLGEERDRSVNYLVTDAILQYVDRKEKDRKKA
jgi:predicted transcriptional regulator